jgi:hypothetical protein
MSTENRFPSLEGFEPTRQTLHRYSNVLGVVSRAHGEFHPKWWHISLKVEPDGLTTDEIALPSGGTLVLKMDLRRHDIVLATSSGTEQRWSMAQGTTSTELGNQLLSAVADLGLSGDYARQKFESDEPRAYDPDAAERFRQAVVLADHILQTQRDRMGGDMGIVQLWPHGFDLACEWYGTRVETYEHEGEVQEQASQINFGFYPGEPIYFYSNPWPFEKDQLVNHPLPEGADWHLEGWEGSILPYADVVGDPNAEERLLAYFGEVYKVASPTLLA